VFGHIHWDNEEWVDDHFPFHRQSWEPLSFATHFHSLDDTLIMGDGMSAFVFTSESQARPYIQLFIRRLSSAWDGERHVGPRILAYHRSTFNNQHAHCPAP
jgi:hypothetical protein